MSLVRYSARRLAAAIPMVLGVAALALALVHLAPGDPSHVYGGEGGTAEYYAEIRHRLGLDRPVAEQVLRSLWGLVRGDLGRSLHQNEPVAALILERVPATALLAGSAFVLASATGVALGVWAASRPHGWVDRALLGASVVASALPVFWVGLVLALVFSLHLGWLPAQGMSAARPLPPGWPVIADRLAHLVLPVVALSLQPLASISRLARAKVLETLAEPYIVTARAKGLGQRSVLRHALRNALLPVVTVLGSYATVLVTGAVLTETVFAWPGLGRLALDATLSRDYPLIVGLIVVATLGTMAITLVTDLLYAALDPRIVYA